MTKHRQLTVVGLGEALFDRFEHEDLLGGAPLNLSIHAHAMLPGVAGRGVVASRVGNDPLGQRVGDALERLGVDASFLQRDAEKPTGDVRVSVAENGSPTYAISTDVAWDRLEFTSSWQQLARSCSAVAFGTLAQRSSVSRATIHSFLQATSASCFRVFDVNLRQDFYDREVLESSLRLANVLKLNTDEFEMIAELLGLTSHDVDGRLQLLLEKFDLSLIALTRGARGTRVITPAAEAAGVVEIVERTPQADSVGAGDAACAGLVVGLLQGWSLEDTVEIANQAGAWVASQAGATPALPPKMVDWIRLTQLKYTRHRHST